MLNYPSKEAINMLWEKTGSSQEQSQSVDTLHQDGNIILDPAPSEASTITFDKSGNPPRFPHSTGVLGYDNAGVKSDRMLTAAHIAMLKDSERMLDKLVTPSKFLQSMGGLGYVDDVAMLDHVRLGLATRDNSGVAQKLSGR